MNPRVLLIEDNAPFRRTVARALKMHGYKVFEAGAGKAGIEKAKKGEPDLIILDLVLPGMQGTEVCLELKKDVETAGIPILILTGNDKEGQDIALLDMGADDYLSKPVKSERLLAYCRALLRRAGQDSQKRGAELRLGPLLLDTVRKLVVLGDKEYPHLTPKEFSVLYHLALCSPAPCGRGALYRKVWEMAPPSEGSLKTVEVHVRRIRLKMGWRSNEWLTTMHGRGYCLVPPESTARG